MAAYDELLDAAAQDGSLDISKWPALVEQVLKRLEHIVYHDFPVPILPPPRPVLEPEILGAEPGASVSTPPRPSDSDAAPSSTEQAASPSIARSTPPPSIVPGSSIQAPSPGKPTSSSTQAIPNSQPSDSTPTLPPPVHAAYRAIVAALRSTSFAAAPPFTIQRLAELVRHPRQHYRTLPAYLRALDRAVAVSSASTAFPLPSINSSASDETQFLAGDAGGSGAYLAGGGNDPDDFNAAALTRIPWLVDPSAAPAPPAGLAIAEGNGGAGPPRTTDLHTARTERIDGPHGAGSVETVTVGSRHAGFVGGGHFGTSASGRGRAASQHLPPAAAEGNDEPLVPSTSTPEAGEATAVASPPPTEPTDAPPSTTVTSPPPEETPHARGPMEIGMADMGPQASNASRLGDTTANRLSDVFDAEAAIGRPGEAETVASPPPGSLPLVRSPRAPMLDVEGEGMEMDAEGKAEGKGEEKAKARDVGGEKGEGNGMEVEVDGEEGAEASDE